MMDNAETSPRLRAAVRLHLAEGVGSLAYRRLSEAFGGPEGVLAAAPMLWRQVEGIGEKTARAIGEVADAQVDEEFALASERGARVIDVDDATYPAALKNIHDPPPLLYVWGSLEPADAVALGVVGARRCSHYGLEQAERFAQLLARAGFTVVSGGARGIDAAAHRGALAAGGRTLAVMGCGLCKTYPPENRKLFEQIASEGRGAVISELPMRTDIRAGNFHSRNRVISGLSLGVLVIEAARHSGSLITAREAIEQGREVFALPGRVDSVMSQGTNDMIREHSAALVQNLEDILDQLGHVGRTLRPDQPPGEHPLAEAANLSDVERRLAECLAGETLGIDELARRAGLPVAQAAASLTMLVIKGMVAQQPGQVFSLRRAK
jgi:DNA processing protein